MSWEFEFARGQHVVDCVHHVCAWSVVIRHFVQQLSGRDVRGQGRGEQLHVLPDQHVLWGDGGVVVRGVSGERAVGGGECLAGILLLQERVCACGGRVHVPDLRSRHVQQPAGAHGVLELLGGPVLGEFRGDRQRDVSELPARAVVPGGQPELQPVPCELAGCELERGAEQLRVRRRVHGAERRPVLDMRCWSVQERDGLERVCSVPGGDVFVGRGECVRLSCEYICSARPKLCRLSHQPELAGAEHRQ